MGKKLATAVNYTNDYRVGAVSKSEKWTSTGGQNYSRLHSLEVGLADNTAPNGNFTVGQDDINVACGAAGAPTNHADQLKYNRPVLIEKLKLKAMIRNNCNIGVLVKVYRVAPRQDVSVTDNSKYIISRLITAFGQSGSTTQNQNQMPFINTLFDYPEICSDFYLKKIDERIIYPGETHMYKISSPVAGKVRTVSNITTRISDSRFHRALVFQTCGLPVHNNGDDPFEANGIVDYGPYTLDVLYNQQFKVRRINDEAAENEIGYEDLIQEHLEPSEMELMPAVNPANVNVAD